MDNGGLVVVGEEERKNRKKRKTEKKGRSMWGLIDQSFTENQGTNFIAFFLYYIKCTSFQLNVQSYTCEHPSFQHSLAIYRRHLHISYMRFAVWCDWLS